MASTVQTGFLDRAVTVADREYRYQVYVPNAYTPRSAWPVILFLHGAGERGTDGLLQTVLGLGPAIRRSADRFPAIVVFPQTPRDAAWTGAPADAAIAALDRTLAEFSTDADRVYLTGVSLGGHGAWYLAYRHPDRFAAIVPICSWIDETPGVPPAAAIVPANEDDPFVALAQRLAHIPIWIFHGEVDPVVPVDQSRRIHAALRAAGARPRFSELPGIEHNAWDPAFGSTAMTTWLFAQRRAS